MCLERYILLSHELDRIEAENRAAVSRMLAERVRPPSTLNSQPSALSPAPFIPPPEPLPYASLVGALAIPRLRLSAPVLVGDDQSVLAGAVGYLPETTPPWEDGNTALAAHRDRLFRVLAGIREGDEIRLSTRHGDFRYAVSRTFIVNPKDVWILDSAPGVNLTLITCYPFWYVGHAPHRFVVRARRIS